MGLRNALRLTSAASSTSTVPAPRALAPWASTDVLASLVWSDLLEPDAFPIDRAAAMAVPAMARARHLIAGNVASCPLVAMRAGVILEGTDAPTWTYRTDGPVSPYHRMLWTVDDVLFTGWSLWRVVRSEGAVVDAERVPRDSWAFGDDGRTLVDADGRPLAPASAYVLIPGPHEGVLAFAHRTLRAAGRLERSAARHAANPVPSIALEQTADVEITEAERDAIIAQWVKARASENGAVGWTGYGVRAVALGAVPEQLLIDGRNAAAVDVARHTSIPAAMLDATNAGASLTYETTEGRNGQFLDYGLSLYFDAIAARLSLDDVAARGTRILFDTSTLTSVSDSIATGTAVAVTTPPADEGTPQ